MRSFPREITVAVIFLVLLGILFNPWNVFMPTFFEMMVMVALLALFGVFANLIWRERGGDERERLHSMFADRIAFLAGSGILLIATILGEFEHQLNPWILLTLAVMVLAKVIGLLYTKNKL